MSERRMTALAEELLAVRDNGRDFATQPALRLDRLVRAFYQGSRKIDVLNGASADIFPGQAVALVGPSGAGKSTLLHISGLLETPDGGRVIINGRDCTGMPDAERTRVRRVQMGFVYQFHQLLPEFSALENIMIPQLILGRSKRQARQRAAQLLGSLGLADRVDHRPAQLSGGEQQRTAIARALANDPRHILAHVFDALIHLIRTTGVAALICTHNLDLARRMDRVLRLENGLLVEVQPLSLR
jgi:lipoprotein-releasing system ATP-binding protein